MSETKNIIEKATEERKKLLEAAENNAKNKLAEAMADRFKELFNEELKKIENNEPLNESNTNDKKNDTERVKTSGKTKESKRIDENMDLTQASLKEVEDEFDNASDDDEFNVQNDFINLEELEKELENLEQISSTEEPEGEVVAEPETGVEPNSEISAEISTEVEPAVDENVNDPYTRIKKLEEELSNIVKEMENTKLMGEYDKEFNDKMVEMYGESYKDSLGDSYNSLKEMFVNKKKGTKPEEKIQEEVIPTEETPDNEIEESHGVGLSQQKGVNGNQLPRPEYANYKKEKIRLALQKENAEKKTKFYISENKKLSKLVNEQKAIISKSNEMLKEHNEVLKKYRKQLNEMAIFNTNLSHTNNLLVNEELTLNSSDKVDIINKFKNINSINESEKLYKSLVNDYMKTKSKIDESVESKLNNDVLEKSNKQVLDESIKEKTGYSANSHIDKIKRINNYIENK